MLKQMLNEVVSVRGQVLGSGLADTMHGWPLTRLAACANRQSNPIIAEEWIQEFCHRLSGAQQ